MGKLENEQLTAEQLEIKRLKLELELVRQEEAKRKIELELKELAQEKQIEEKQKPVEQVEKPIEQVEKPKDLEESNVSIEKVQQSIEKAKQNTKNQETFKLDLGKGEKRKKPKKQKRIKDPRFKKILPIGSTALIVVLIIFVWQYIATQKYYDSIPLILNVEDYYDKTWEDIIEMYGRPDDPNNQYYSKRYGTVFNSADLEYDMGDYNLWFSFEHGYINLISYDPDIGYSYEKNQKDALYLFGIGDKSDLFTEVKYPKKFKCEGDNYLSQFFITELNEEAKTGRSVVLCLKEQYPEREVFEGDFSDTPVIFNMVQYLGTNQMYVYNSLGSNMTVNEYGIWEYTTDIGTLTVRFDDKDCVEYMKFKAYTPIKYEESPQEAMVMFGVNPNLDMIYLSNYGMFGEYYHESYRNFMGEDSGIFIDDIDLNNKTFIEVSIDNVKSSF